MCFPGEAMFAFKTSSQTMEEISESNYPVVRACEPVAEVEADVENSRAQSALVSDSWLVMLSMVN